MGNLHLFKHDSESVFLYVRQLSQKQKQQFSIHFKPGKGKKKPHFFLLYEGIQGMQEFDAPIMRALIPSKNYKKVLNALIEKLIYVQLIYQTEEKPRLAIIRTAISLGAIQYARTIIAEEFKTELQKGNLHQLLQVWKIIHHLRRTYGVDLRPDLPEGHPDELEILQCLELTVQAEHLLDELEVGFQWQYSERLELVGNIIPLTQAIAVTQSQLSPIYVYPAYRVMVRAYLLAGELDKAIQYQSYILRLVPHLPPLDLGDLLYEYQLMAHLQASAKAFAQAAQFVQAIQQAETRHPIEENLRRRFEVKCMLGLGLRSWNLDLAQQAYDLLEAHPELFLDVERGMFHYQIALIHFVNGQYDKTCVLLRDLINLPHKANQQVRIWAELLLAAAYISRDEWVLAGDVLDNCIKAIQREKLELALLIHNMLKLLHPYTRKNTPAERLENARRAFLSLLREGKDVQYLWYFDALQWFEACERGITCKALHDLGEPGWAWNGLVEELDLAFSYREVIYPLPSS